MPHGGTTKDANLAPSGTLLARREGGIVTAAGKEVDVTVVL